MVIGGAARLGSALSPCVHARARSGSKPRKMAVFSQRTLSACRSLVQAAEHHPRHVRVFAPSRRSPRGRREKRRKKNAQDSELRLVVSSPRDVQRREAHSAACDAERKARVSPRLVYSRGSAPRPRAESSICSSPQVDREDLDFQSIEDVTPAMHTTLPVNVDGEAFVNTHPPSAPQPTPRPLFKTARVEVERERERDARRPRARSDARSLVGLHQHLLDRLLFRRQPRRRRRDLHPVHRHAGACARAPSPLSLFFPKSPKSTRARTPKNTRPIVSFESQGDHSHDKREAVLLRCVRNIFHISRPTHSSPSLPPSSGFISFSKDRAYRSSRPTSSSARLTE